MRGILHRSAVIAVAALVVTPSVAQARSLRVPARVADGAVQVREGERYVKRFWAGVNLGATVPGTLPGELAVTRREYDRWLAGMGELGVNVVRVYTVLKPRFYEALAAYNARHPRRPIRFIQGVWIPEQRFLVTRDAYAASDGFDRDIAGAVRAVHGAGSLPPRRGYASGRYRADVSRWLLAWSIGVEWDPEATKATDDAHAGTPPFQGRFVSATPEATPMESWLAARLNRLATLEAARGWSRPVTFTNWVTTDPLHHPGEPLIYEDQVSIDAKHLVAGASWPGGLFASYHVYPYYPDFLGLGQTSYADYLRALRAHHGTQPVMITELGVPSSLGVAHTAPAGRDQGGHSERQAGAIDAAMLREVKATGMAGGVLFAWIDEWFKHTWNTQAQEVPFARRALWRNELTNEEHFGVLAADPVPGRAHSLGHGVSASTDPAAVRLSIPTRATRVTIGVDVRPGPRPAHPGLPVPAGADVAVQVDGRRATVLQHNSWEPTGILHARDGVPPAAPWQPARQLTSYALTIPTTGQVLPARTHELEALPVRRSRGRIMVSLPWALLGFSDPSSRRIFVAHDDGGTVTTTLARRLRFSVSPAGATPYALRPLTLHGWSRVRWRERRKASWPTLRATFHRLAR